MPPELQNWESISMAVVSLKKIKKEGVRYQRRLEVQALIVDLLGLTSSELVQKCTNYKDPVPMEVMVYFLRHITSLETFQFEAIFKAFILRVEVSLKKFFSDTRFELASDLRQEAMDRLITLIARDINEGETKLDYFEVNFNDAFVKLRSDVKRKILPSAEVKPGKKISIKKADILGKGMALTDDESGEILPHVDEIVSAIYELGVSKLDDPSFRFRLYAAINDLPDDERRVVGLMLQGIQINAKDPNTPSISKMLGCADRTVRNRLRRAYTKLQKAFPAEEEL